MRLTKLFVDRNGEPNFAAQSVSRAPFKRQRIFGELKVALQHFSESFELLLHRRPAPIRGTNGCWYRAPRFRQDPEHSPCFVRSLAPSIDTAEFGVVVRLGSARNPNLDAFIGQKRDLHIFPLVSARGGQSGPHRPLMPCQFWGRMRRLAPALLPSS